MSEQPPLTPPSGQDPSFPTYGAPAYGDVSPEPPTGAEPTLIAPAPTAPSPAAPTPPAPTPQAPVDSRAGWAPYPVAPSSPTPYQVAPQYVSHLGAPTHPMATTSLVLGIIGIAAVVLTPVVIISFIGVVCSPFAIWLGARSRREIRANPQAYSGEGLATGGLITGIVGLVLGILALLAIVAIVVLFVGLIGASSS